MGCEAWDLPRDCPGTARLTKNHPMPLPDWVQGLLPPPTPPTHHGYADGVGCGSGQELEGRSLGWRGNEVEAGEASWLGIRGERERERAETEALGLRVE